MIWPSFSLDNVNRIFHCPRMKYSFQSKRAGLLAALLVAGAASNANSQVWQPAPAPLMTRWAKEVSPENPLPEYPRPQMVRKDWQSLNGLWESALTDTDAAPPSSYDGRILVPYPYESALSGVGKPSIPGNRLWYRRTFAVPGSWNGQRVLLNFGAVNYDSAVYVNGKKVGEHRGGYDGFSFDVTEQLKLGANEIVVSAWNPIRADVDDAQVIGKQRLHPGGIFYTGATGIWQPVWLEPVPAGHITGLKLVPDIDAGVLKVRVATEGATDLSVRVVAQDGGKILATINGKVGEEIVVPIRKAHLWSPNDPHLYDLQVTLQHGRKKLDGVNSYFAMRKISLGKDTQGRNRIFLNNQFLLEIGALDQGYWPDGIYTAPTDAALRYDIEVAKDLGWNLLRKHAKVEPARWYYHCDRLGMLVWQDMPAMFGGHDGKLTDGAKQQYELEWRRIIAEFYNAPSIIVWTTFNEGWGQHDTESVVALTKQLDPTRLVNNASGWTDKNVGDIHDVHAYPGPWCELPEDNRASVDGEFGGITMSVPDHRWNAQVMGYGAVLKDSRISTKRYQDLLKTAYRLSEDRGGSAFVYTQITDVEQEINGLLTYDRAMIKMIKEVASAANHGSFLPLPPNSNADLVPTSEDEPIVWQYTTTRPSDDWSQAGFDASQWSSGRAPFGHDMSGVNTAWQTDDIWLRRTVTLPNAIPAKLKVLARHDEDVEVYVNGVLAASAGGFKDEYVSLPMSEEARASLKPGVNTIAVHCHQTIGGQGIDVGIAEDK